MTAIVALAGTYLTTRINEENNLRDTINQREQAESALRTSMFRELVSPVVGNTGAMVDEPQRLALLAELLALNFHEHFELGPLLTYVDELPGQATQDRNRLRSIGRRVVSRQLAVLGPAEDAAPGAQCSTERTDVDIWLTSDASEASMRGKRASSLQGDDSTRLLHVHERRSPIRPRTWFPREFIPPRERPTDFEHIRRSLKCRPLSAAGCPCCRGGCSR